jgi:hypothetical protein
LGKRGVEGLLSGACPGGCTAGAGGRWSTAPKTRSTCADIGHHVILLRAMHKVVHIERVMRGRRDLPTQIDPG